MFGSTRKISTFCFPSHCSLQNVGGRFGSTRNPACDKTLRKANSFQCVSCHLDRVEGGKRANLD